MEDYKIIGHIGEGAHGHVLKAHHRKLDKSVALKRVLFKATENKIPINVLREIKILLMMDCEYVVKLTDYFPQSNSMVLVFEFVPSGLWEILHDLENMLTIPQIKCYMQMLLKGVSYLHKNSIMHRDLKPANLLINDKGILKIADFGLSRLMWNNKSDAKLSLYTPQVATRWYRAPELLYGSRCYNQGIDLWAVGCIFAEMINKSPLFPGENDIEQLAIVLHNLGTPTEENWPGLNNLPDYNKISFPTSVAVPFDVLIPDTDPLCIHLIKSFLLYDSDKRISAKEALIHKYFFIPPLPCLETKMPIPKENHRQMIKDTVSQSTDNIENMLDDLKDFLL